MALGTYAIGTRAIGDGAPVLTGAYSSGGTTYTVSVSGAVTPSGVLLKQIQKHPAGVIGPTGSVGLLSSEGIFIGGGITPAGTLTKRDSKSPSGAIGPSGALSLVVNPTPPAPPSPSHAIMSPAFIPISHRD